jgi:hypothetical protein
MKIQVVVAAAVALTACAGGPSVGHGGDALLVSWDRGMFMEVTKPSGDARIRFGGNSNHPCLRGYMKVKVEWTERDLTLQPVPNMADCPTFRWLVRRDGSGGERQVLMNDRWVRAEFNPGVKILRD